LIYYATIGFLSGSLVPFMIVIFTIFIAVIIITLFGVMRKVIEKGFGG